MTQSVSALKIAEAFISDELAVRRDSYEPGPTDPEKGDIAQAATALQAVRDALELSKKKVPDWLSGQKADREYLSAHPRTIASADTMRRLAYFNEGLRQLLNIHGFVFEPSFTEIYVQDANDARPAEVKQAYPAIAFLSNKGGGADLALEFAEYSEQYVNEFLKETSLAS